MHELAVTKDLVNLILQNSTHPKKVVVELGAMTTYKSEPIRYYFDIIRQEYPSLSDVKLVLIEIPAFIHCRECDEKSVLEEPFIEVCPVCGSWKTDVLQGKDFILKSITEN